MQPVMIPSPDPSMGPGGMMNVPGLNEPQWGSNLGVVREEDPEMTRNRQFGYAVMACAVVALAVLMVSLQNSGFAVIFFIIISGICLIFFS